MPAAPPPSSAMLRHWLWGPLSPLGLGIAALTVLIDHHKAWMLTSHIGSRRSLTPFFDWRGVESGQLRVMPQEAWRGWGVMRYVRPQPLPGGLMERSLTLRRPRSALSSRRIGNAIDRIAYGAVADFFSLHAFGYQWYVFNIADMAIVAGVVGLLYDSLFRGHKKVGNPSKM